MRLRFVRVLPLVALSLAACTDSQHGSDVQPTDAANDAVDHVTPTDIVQPDVPVVEDVQDVQPPEDVVEPDVVPDDVPMPMGPPFCTFPGSTVPGAILPSGFCIREFVPHTGSVDGSAPGSTPDHISAPRNMSFAPNGDLFVASPSMGTAGGAGGGLGGIYVVTDTDHDGRGEIHVFNQGIPDVHGLAVTADTVYWTTGSGVFSTSYAAGQLTENAASRMQLATLSNGAWRWTHGLMRSVGGHLYMTSGVWGASCPDTNVGAIFEVAGGSLRMVSQGFRNPMYGRCHFRDEVCAIDELGDDGGGSWGAREKMLLLHEASNYGYACCATTNRPAPGATTSCAETTTEESSMDLNDTPFGLDWERGYWGSPYRGGVFVAKHGSFYSSPSWHNVGIWWAPTNAATHAPSGAFTLLVDGFGPSPSTGQLRRPADVTFAADGRLFFADDHGGGIYWVAPDTLRSP